MRTIAKRDGVNFILNGSKAFISGSGVTDCLVLMARTGDAGAKGISCFLIPADSPGIEYGKNEPKMGWKNQPTRLVSLTVVKVSKINLIMTKPLEGLTVLEFSQFLSGPYAGLRLADLGARVIKIERPDVGDLCRTL